MSPLSIAAVFVALGISTVLLIVVIAAVWWFDRYDREPLHLVAAAFLWGALAAPVLAVTGCSIAGAGLDLESIVLVGLVGPLVEEIAKALGLILLVLISREFDNPTDGVVYGTATGLGFAATENLVYTVAGAGETFLHGTLLLVVLRTAMAAGIHAVSSATFGGCLGFAYLSRGRAQRLIWTATGLLGATAIHSGWNLALLRLKTGGEGMSVGGWLVVLPALYVLYLVALVAFLRSEQKILGRELAEEVALEVVPDWVLEVIPYYRRRVRSDWWPSRRERTVLARLLTRLAFRKHAVRHLPQGESKLAGLEVVKLRQRIRTMLRNDDRSDID